MNDYLKEINSLFSIRKNDKQKQDFYNYLCKEMGEEKITVKKFFDDYGIGVWCSDYKVENDLFCINESVDVRERLHKSTTQIEVTTTEQRN